MPWSMPTLDDVRKQNRDYITGQLNSGSMIPNSVLRVLSDAAAGLGYLCLLFIDYLSQQLLPDTADDYWLKNRHAQIWLGGYKQATYSAGTATFTGEYGTIVPAGTPLSQAGVTFQTTAQITIGGTATPAAIQATVAGIAGNLDEGSRLALTRAISGVDATAVVVGLSGGNNEEATEDLRVRVLNRIRQPPMGGDADDYVAWALGFPGVTRAWCSPLEMGPGSVTLRFMMDDLRASTNPMTDGFPLQSDVDALKAHIDTLRPVTTKDFFVFAPIPEPINFGIQDLDDDTPSVRAAVAASVSAMLADRARPGFSRNGVAQPAQEIFAAWVSDAILAAAGVESFDLVMDDHPMPTSGSMAVLGTITYG